MLNEISIAHIYYHLTVLRSKPVLMMLSKLVKDIIEGLDVGGGGGGGGGGGLVFTIH